MANSREESLNGHSLTPDEEPLRIAARDLVARDLVAHFNPHTDGSGSPLVPEGTLMKTRTPIQAAGLCGIFAAVAFLVVAWSVIAAPPVKLTNDVASPADLTAEVGSLLAAADQGLASVESYNDRRDQLKRQAIQIAILAQALAEHEIDSPLKKSAPGLRNAALALARAASFDEAAPALARLKEAAEGKLSGTPAVEADWGKLARAGFLMPAMKERSESIRRALRRPKDPDMESRHAMAIALMILAVHGDTQAVKNPADKPAWQECCVELQGHMSRAAAAIKARNDSAVDHFRLGMEACDKCHQKFKP